MDNRGFWSDTLRGGAWLGLLMGLSAVLETYGMFLSGSEGALLLVMFEWLAVAVLFVWMLYRLARRRAERCAPELGFAYSQALLFTICLSAAAGIIAGVMKYVFVSIVGYDTVTNGYLDMLYHYKTVASAADMSAGYVQLLDDMIESVRTARRPSILATVFSSLESYAVAGAAAGLVISGIVRRDPSTRSDDKR